MCSGPAIEGGLRRRCSRRRRQMGRKDGCWGRLEWAVRTWGLEWAEESGGRVGEEGEGEAALAVMGTHTHTHTHTQWGYSNGSVRLTITA